MKSLYPFESHYLDLDGARYHYLDEGIGEPLVMVHGNPTWSFYYRNLILHLRSRFRVICPDHVGCGLSDKPQDYDYTLQQHISNLTALVQRLDLKNITFFMHDWGGPISMGYAVQNPRNVKGLVIFNTAAFWIPQIPLGIRLLRNSILGAVCVRYLNLFVRAGTIMGCRRKPMTREVKSGYLAPYDSFANRIGVMKFIWDIPLNESDRCYVLLRSIESKLHVLADHKKLIIWGGKDPVFTKDFLGEWIKRFPGVPTKIIEDAGHYVVEDGLDLILPWVEEFLTVNSTKGNSISSNTLS